ncbi:MAG: DUF5690 family protein [Bacteroidia bacterium]
MIQRLFASPVWAMAAAFGAYFCMYGFRKPFTAGAYADMSLWGLDYKTVLVIAQTLGYAVSKWIGIKVISEMRPHQRAAGILVLIGFAQLMLLGFGLVPAPWNFALLFLNGLPLGMVFGLVQGFLEGRRMSEALIAGLCASFILADGFTKSTGGWLLSIGTPEYWMPFLAGLLFVLPLLLFVWMLTRVPAPSAEDIALRAERKPMNGADRRRFFRRYLPGLLGIAVMFLLVTLLRSIRADFAPEIWAGLGYTGVPGIYTQSEVYVLLGVMLVNGLSVLIRDNRVAFFVSLAVSALGLLLVLVALWGGDMSGFWFMVLIGLGLYIPYVAVHTTVFERLIAMTRDNGNIGFLMYVVDTVGYLGYIALMFTKSRILPDTAFLDFFSQLSLIIVVLGVLSLLLSAWHFAGIRQVPAAAVGPEGA